MFPRSVGLSYGTPSEFGAACTLCISYTLFVCSISFRVMVHVCRTVCCIACVCTVVVVRVGGVVSFLLNRPSALLPRAC